MSDLLQDPNIATAMQNALSNMTAWLLCGLKRKDAPSALDIAESLDDADPVKRTIGQFPVNVDLYASGVSIILHLVNGSRCVVIELVQIGYGAVTCKCTISDPRNTKGSFGIQPLVVTNAVIRYPSVSYVEVVGRKATPHK